MPRPLDLYELLPRSNCRGCGEATCMAFVFGLLEARHRPGECPKMADSAGALQRAALDALLANLGGDGGDLQPD